MYWEQNQLEEERGVSGRDASVGALVPIKTHMSLSLILRIYGVEIFSSASDMLPEALAGVDKKFKNP